MPLIPPPYSAPLVQVIPHAVDWYTGKAVEESMLLWQGDEDIVDDEDEDEEEDEEEEGGEGQ